MSNAVVMSLLLAVGLGTFSALMWPRLRLLWAARPEARFDHLARRFWGMLRFALFQGRMPRDPVAGFAHICIFSGFVVVSVATVTHFARAFAADWYFPGLGGAAGQYYLFIKDVFEVLVLVGVAYALWRRLRPKASRVGRSWEGVFILLMIATLMITDFLTYGGELVVRGQSGLPYNPAGHLASLWLAPWGPDTAHTIAITSWWIHCVAILVFLNFLPLGKHFHVITSFPKVFFRDLKPWGQVAKVDLEGAESFGIRTTADLSWSMVLDTYSCTECGRCNVFCPTALTGKPLSHRQLNRDLRSALFADKAGLLSADLKKREELPPLVDGRILADTIWACTTCGACEQECPLFIENVPRIIQMRQNKVLMDGDIAPELARAYKGMENNQNPWGIGFDQRDKWADGLDVPRLADLQGEPPLLYWIGCAGAFDDRNKKVTLAMVKILKAAGVPFAILGKEEACTGDPARRTGNEYLFQELARKNVERLNKYKVKRVLTHCPHCLHTLGSEYPQFGGNYEVVHHSQLIDELIAGGRLQLTRERKSAVAWHDSCYLGRYHHEYDAPRRAVRAVPGTELVELPRRRSRSVCCGAGGGRFWMEETIGERINTHRSKEALAAGTDTIGVSCPFCMTMIKDGVAEQGKADSVRTLDVAEIVAEALA